MTGERSGGSTARRRRGQLVAGALRCSGLTRPVASVISSSAVSRTTARPAAGGRRPASRSCARSSTESSPSAAARAASCCTCCRNRPRATCRPRVASNSTPCSMLEKMSAMATSDTAMTGPSAAMMSTTVTRRRRPRRSGPRWPQQRGAGAAPPLGRAEDARHAQLRLERSPQARATAAHATATGALRIPPDRCHPRCRPGPTKTTRLMARAPSRYRPIADGCTTRPRSARGARTRPSSAPAAPTATSVGEDGLRLRVQPLALGAVGGPLRHADDVVEPGVAVERDVRRAACRSCCPSRAACRGSCRDRRCR